MTRKMMTETEAWRTIAEKIESLQWVSMGLCLSAHGLHQNGTISGRVRESMLGRVSGHMALTTPECLFFSMDFDRTYLAPPGEWEVRVLAAYFLALEAEDEAAVTPKEEG